MIIIKDEPIFTMTEQQYQEFWEEYGRSPYCDEADMSFEEWLRAIKCWPYTTYQQENP